MPKPQPTVALTTIADISRRYQVSRWLIRRAIAADEIETVRIAGHVFLKTKSAHAWGRQILADTAPICAVA